MTITFKIMRKKIANWLVRLAMKINPVQTIPVFEKNDVYQPKVCGSAYSISKKDIKAYKKDTGEKSTRAAVRALIRKGKAKAKHDIFDCIEACCLQERVYANGGDTVVEMKCNLYVPKENR